MFENNSIRIPEWPPGVHDDESSPASPESVRRPAAAAPETPTEETPPEERAPTDEDVPAEIKSSLRKAGLHDQPTSGYGEQFSPQAAQYAVVNL